MMETQLTETVIKSPTCLSCFIKPVQYLMYVEKKICESRVLFNLDRPAFFSHPVLQFESGKLHPVSQAQS